MKDPDWLNLPEFERETRAVEDFRLNVTAVKDQDYVTGTMTLPADNFELFYRTGDGSNDVRRVLAASTICLIALIAGRIPSFLLQVGEPSKPYGRAARRARARMCSGYLRSRKSRRP